MAIAKDSRDVAKGSSEDGTGGSLLSRAPMIGRRLATLLFWFGALYMAAAAFYSIPQQLFWPEASAAAPAADCATGVVELRAELLSHASTHVETAGTGDLGELESWLHSWDLRHASLAQLCEGDGEYAHEALGRMRHRIEDALKRNIRDLAPLTRDIDRGLSKIASH